MFLVVVLIPLGCQLLLMCATDGSLFVQMSTNAQLQRHTPVLASATTLKEGIIASALQASWAILLYKKDAKLHYHK